MNAIEIRNLRKNFGSKRALNGLNMTVPMGAIYGFIGENGSGKTTTEKIMSGLIHADGGEVKLLGKDHTDAGVRERIGVLIESPGCFPHLSVWNNLMLQSANLGLEKAEDEVKKILKIVRMEGAANNKFKNCSLGMKQRIGIAMALLGEPEILILDEPINGLDVDGMRIMREILTDITKDKKCTAVVSSHILGELEKIATHYGFVRGGKMLCEMTASQLEADCPTYVAIRSDDVFRTKSLLMSRFSRVTENEDNMIGIYDAMCPEEVVSYLYENGIVVSEVKTDKINLEEYYLKLMGEVKR